MSDMPKKDKIVTNNLVVPIEQVHPNDYNPKVNYDKTPELKAQFEKILNSLKYHGQGDPIKVRETKKGKYEIMDGYHRYQAMKKLGYKEIEIKNFGPLTREEAIKITLTMEETGVDIDPIMRAQLLKDFKELGHDISGLPYTIEEIDAHIQILNYDFSHANDKEGPDERKLKEIECPHCHETFTI